MNSLIKDNKKKIIEWVFTLVSFIIVWILAIELFLGNSYPEYTRSLKNGYYIEYIPGKGSKLKNAIEKYNGIYIIGV